MENTLYFLKLLNFEMFEKCFEEEDEDSTM